MNDNLATELLTEQATKNNATLPAAAKRALVTLLKFGVVLASQKPQLFESLCHAQAHIRRHLAEIYLKLILDEKTGVAFVANFDSNDFDEDNSEEPISLITRRTLSLYDTLVLLVLRKFYQEREVTGEQKIIIDIERIETNLIPFLALTNNSKSDRRKLSTALQKMIDKRILVALRNNEDRFEITPVIRYVVSAEFLESLLQEYQRIAKEADLDIETEAKEQ